MAKPLKELTEEQKELAFDLVLDGKNLEEIAKPLGFKNARELQRYKMKNPEFLEIFERARLLECEQIVEEVRNITKNFNAEYGKLQLEILTRILKWRDPKKYSEKTQIDMAIHIDISGCQERAERRVKELTTSNVVSIVGKQENREE